MARKNGEQLGGRKQRLWDEAGEGILSMLEDKHPSNLWHRKGPHITGKCPFHDDDSPSFIVSPTKGIAKCFGCSIVFTDFLGFAKRICNVPMAQTVQYLRKRLGMRASISDAQIKKAALEEETQKHLLKFFTLCGETLKEAIIAYGKGDNFESTPQYFFAKDTVEGLRDRRLGMPLKAHDREERVDPYAVDPFGIIETAIANQLIAVLPPLAMVKNHYKDDPDGMAFVHKYWGQYLESGGSHAGYFILPYHTSPGVFGCFKIRAPQRANKAMAYVGTEPGSSVFRGYYGFHYARVWLGPTAITGAKFNDSVYFVEGEFDALQAIAHQIRSGQDDYVCLAIGGSSLQPPDMMPDLGITNVFLTQDRDRGGTNIVENFLRNTTSPALKYHIFNWPTEYVEWRDPTDPERRIKDPDDAIKCCGYERWRRYVCTSDTYTLALDWVLDKASQELSTLASGDIREKSNTAIDWGRLLLDQHECRKFTQILSEQYGIDASVLLQQIFSKDEGEAAFVERLLDMLKQKFHFVGCRSPEAGKRVLVFYSKTKRVIDNLPLGDLRMLESIFTSYFGTLYEYVNQEVGEPAFMGSKAEGGADILPIALKSRKYAEYIAFALQKLVPSLPNLDHTPFKAQGYHYFGEKNGEHQGYLVNGQDVYHMTHAGGILKTRLLEGPSDGHVLFNTRDAAWLKIPVQALDFDTAGMDPVEIFTTLRDMLHASWGWQNVDGMRDATFLAAFCMCVPIMNAFNRQVAIMLNAEPSSGKSRFLGGFLGGHEFPGIHMVAHTVVMSGYTEAAIRQQRDGSTLCLCLEEFEDDGSHDRRAQVVRRALELFRDLISETEVRWSVGSTSGHARTFTLRFPLACAAIHPLRDGASLSRFVPFALKHVTAKADPQHTMMKGWGPEKIAQTRNALSIGMYKHIPAIREIQAKVISEYATGEFLPAYVPSRFREALTPVLTMLRFLRELPGGEAAVPYYREFARDFSEDRKDFLHQLHTTAINEQVFQTILESPLKQDNGTLSQSVRSMLGDLNALEKINETRQGIFYDSKNDWLVVVWIQAIQGVLSNTAYRAEKPVYFKKVAERSPHFISVEDAKRERVLERLSHIMGPGVSHDLVSVFSVKNLVEETRANYAARAAAKTSEGKVVGSIGVAPAPPTDLVTTSSPTHIGDIGV